MWRYISKRLILIAITFLVAVTFAFTFLRLTPGDPVAALLDYQYTQEEYDSMEHYLGLDRPIIEQFFKYFFGVLRGDLGQTLSIPHRPVSLVILQKLPYTLRLMGLSILFLWCLAVPLGIISALKQYSIIDQLTNIFATFNVAFPGYVAAFLVIYFFALKLGWLPAVGAGDPPDIWHLILPAISIGPHQIGTSTRLMRSSLLEVNRDWFVVAAKARGLSNTLVLIKHALRNALAPVITNLAVLSAQQIGGALAIELVFAYPGVGRLMWGAIATRDYTLIQGCFIIIVSILLIVNLFVDLAYVWIDPRIKL